jgi:hypothetical protein
MTNDLSSFLNDDGKLNVNSDGEIVRFDCIEEAKLYRDEVVKYESSNNYSKYICASVSTDAEGIYCHVWTRSVL